MGHGSRCSEMLGNGLGKEYMKAVKTKRSIHGVLRLYVISLQGHRNS